MLASVAALLAASAAAPEEKDLVTRTYDLRPVVERYEELEPIDPDILIDLPEMEVERLDHALRVPLGKPVLLRVRPDLGKPGEHRALAALVTAVPIEAR